MDIERLGGIGSPPDTSRKRKKKSEAKISRRSAFSDVLEETAELHRGESVDGPNAPPKLDGTETVGSLLDAVHEAGEALRNDPVFGPLNDYKNAVRRFLRYVLAHGLETGEIVGIRHPQTMRRKKYLIIRVVDDKLEKLTAHVLKGQADQFGILRRIDEINGLLVDLSV